MLLTPPTPFVNRQEELAEIRRLLVELLALAADHASGLQNSRDRAARHHTALGTKLPPDIVQAARERGKAADLDAMVNRLLASSDSILERLMIERPARADRRSEALVEPLSQRELHVLRLVADGLSDQQIADTLFISRSTVKVHTRNIRGKLDAKNRLQTVARARSLGLL
jgi:ATP/maltotriose-dependent transcriptional regulator MalT